MPNIIITGKNYKLSPTIKQFVTDKMSKLYRMKNLRISETKVELDFDTNQHSGQIYRVEISVILPGKILKAGAKAYSMQEAINLSLPKIIEQVTKYKDTFLSRKKGHHQREL